MNDKVFEALNDLFDLVTCQGSFEKGQKCYDIIEEALTTKSKKEQAFDVIKDNFEITIDKIDDETSFIEITRKGSNNKCFKIVENELADLLKEAILNED